MSIKINKPLIYGILLFIAIYMSHDTLLFGTNLDPVYNTIRTIIPIIICALLTLFWRFKISPFMLGIFCVFSLLPFLSCIVHDEVFNNYIYRFTIVLMGFLFSVIDKSVFEKYYLKILFFLSCWSLIIWGLTYLFSDMFSSFPQIINTAGTEFNFIGFSVIPQDFAGGIHRNFGLFREPGFFAVMVNLAIYFEVKTENVSGFRLIVFIFTILTTFSTAGYIVLILNFFRILSCKGIKQKRIFILLLVCSGVGLIILGYNYGIFDLVFSKFIEGSNSYGSWFARSQSVISGLKIAFTNPLFGVGRYHLYSTTLGTLGMYVAIDNTNTVIINCASYGLFFGAINIFGIIFFVKDNKTKLGFLVALLVIILSISNEDMNQNVIYYYLIFSGYSMYNKIDKRDKNEKIINNQSGQF